MIHPSWISVSKLRHQPWWVQVIVWFALAYIAFTVVVFVLAIF
jgi:hypothetical protein